MNSNSFELTNKCQQLLTNLESINQQTDQMKQINIIQEQQQIENVILEQTDVKIKLIDDFNKQTDFCYGIVFNNSGSIMISNHCNDILVQEFQIRKIAIIKSIQGALRLNQLFSIQQKNELFHFWELGQISYLLELLQQQRMEVVKTIYISYQSGIVFNIKYTRRLTYLRRKRLFNNNMESKFYKE
ncbi:unnamed protein product (macronuclear) [Paramecium tetraurelia]|uniref:Transmembrane protein n=1 Tax=Paramecium tetraurelia TaxID=5888 RepID=A0D1Y5_PARTE|nr:uncharacterized protein GSPATT00039186001 [Paramecium tetraurelia]CAK77052.1 unnamed protein product [Paramecium tetraurelia]|eukprot:XP_001444449.1 hypothetical protein (macronuclear) [Paramecium tetraurelia strain d4-2]